MLGALDTTVNILENIFYLFGIHIAVGGDIIIKILSKLNGMAEGEMYYGKIRQNKQGRQKFWGKKGVSVCNTK